MKKTTLFIKIRKVCLRISNPYAAHLLHKSLSYAGVIHRFSMRDYLLLNIDSTCGFPVMNIHFTSGFTLVDFSSTSLDSLWSYYSWILGIERTTWKNNTQMSSSLAFWGIFDRAHLAAFPRNKKDLCKRREGPWRILGSIYNHGNTFPS